MRILFLCLLMGLFGAADAEIYKWVDDSGRVHYTDQPTGNSEKIKLSPSTIYSPPEINAGASTTNKPNKPGNSYTSFVILTPANRETLPVNSGDLVVQFQAIPGLQPGHYIQVVLDGRVLDRHHTSLSITLEDLDSGSHMLHASIYNKAGGLLKRSNIVQFFARRETVQDGDDDAGTPPFEGDFNEDFNVGPNSGSDQFGTPSSSTNQFRAPSTPGDKFKAPN